MTDAAGGGPVEVLRMVAAAILVTFPTIAIGWSLVAWWSILPAELPSQWSGDRVVSRLPTLGFVITALVIAAASAAFSWYAALNPGAHDRPRRVFLISGSVAATTATAWLLSGTAASRPDQELGASGLWVFTALFYGFAPFAMAVARPKVGEVEEVDEIELIPSEEIAWTRTQAVQLFVWAAVICAGVAGGFGYLPMIEAGADFSNVSVAAVMSILAVTSFAFAGVRVTVDRRGLRARSATCGIPLVAVRLADVVAASVVTLEPLRWSGWGYRLGARGSALVLRAGPAIVVTLNNGREVAVTTPDAEQAAGVLQALLRRRAA